MKYLMYLSTPTKEKFDETIGQILNKLEYRHLSQKYIDIIDKIKQKIISWLKNWLNSMNFDSRQIDNAVPSISNGIIIIGSVLIILIIILIILYMKKIVKKDKKVKRILGEIIDEKTTTKSLYEKARKHKEIKEYREALRFSFIGLLFHMNENNLLYLDETQTNSEIVYTLKKNNFNHIEMFENAAQLFNEIWYGHKEINEELYESWEEMMLAIDNGVDDIAKKK